MNRAAVIKLIEQVGFVEIDEFECWKHDNHKHLFFFHPERPIIAINWVLYSYCEIEKYLLDHGLMKKEIKYLPFNEAFKAHKEGKSLMREEWTEINERKIWTPDTKLAIYPHDIDATDWFVVEEAG